MKKPRQSLGEKQKRGGFCRATLPTPLNPRQLSRGEKQKGVVIESIVLLGLREGPSPTNGGVRNGASGSGEVLIVVQPVSNVYLLMD